MAEWTFPHADHLSPSSIGDYLRCPQCFKWSRVDRVRYPMSVALPIGGAIHKAAEIMRTTYLRQPEAFIVDEEIPRYTWDPLVEAAAEYFDGHLEVDEETQAEITVELGRKYKSLGEAKDDMVRLTGIALPWLSKLDMQRGLIATEFDLAEVPNPWPFKMAGRIDALFGTREGDDLLVNLGADLKTASAAKEPDYYASLQLGIYAHYIPSKWCIDVMPKTQKPNPQSYFSEVNEEERRAVYLLVMDVAEKIRDGYFPPRPSIFCKFAHGLPEFKLAVSGYAA